jgi:hypothetical protein
MSRLCLEVREAVASSSVLSVPIKHPSFQAKKNRLLWITSPKGPSNAYHVRISGLIGELVEAFFNFLIRLDTVVTINITRLLHTFLDDVRFFWRRPPAVTPGNGICSSPNTQAILTDAAKLTLFQGFLIGPSEAKHRCRTSVARRRSTVAKKYFVLKSYSQFSTKCSTTAPQSACYELF